MAGYTRQSVADIIANAIIKAGPVNAEFDQVLAAFNKSTGHKHDNTTGEGAYVPLIADTDALNKAVIDTANNRIGFFSEVSAAAVEQLRIQDGAIVPVTDDDIDLGASGAEFKDLYVDGIGYIDTVQVHENATITGNLTVNGNTTLGNAATDTVTVTADIASPLIPSVDDNYDLGAVGSEWRNLYVDGTANIDSLVADTADIDGGTIDNAIIGGTTSAAGTFTALTATGTSTLSTVDINAGAIDNTTVGATTASTGAFTTLSASSTLNVTGATGIDGDFDINTNKFTVASATGNTAVAGTLDVTGATGVDGNFDVNTNKFTVNATSGNTAVAGTLDVTGAATLSSTLDVTGVVTANAGVVVDNITIDGTEIDLSSGDLTVDVAGDIILDADGGDVTLKDAGTTYANLNNSSGELVIQSGSTPTTAVTFSGANVDFAGTLDVTGNTTLDADLSVGGNTTITGNLTVNGTTTTVATTNTTVSDGLIELGNGTTGTPANDAGIVIERGDSDNAFIGFDESEDKFKVGTGSFTGASTGDLTVTTGTLIANIEGDVTGTVTGDASGLTGMNTTITELNVMDGDTAATATTLADADTVVVNDAGTMKQVALTDFETYFETALDTLSNVTTVGALDAGSITSNFGAIDNGSSNITTTGTVTYGSLSDGTLSVTAFVDEDDMTSDSATLIPTQQSVKAYVDNNTNVTGLTATGAELNAIADVSAITIDTSTAIASDDGIAIFDTSGSAIGYFDVDLLDTYYAGTTKTLTNKTLTSPTVTSPTITGLQLNDSGFTVEGSSADDNETTVTFTNPTADRTITIPDADGQVVIQDTSNGRATISGTAPGVVFEETDSAIEDSQLYRLSDDMYIISDPSNAKGDTKFVIGLSGSYSAFHPEGLYIGSFTTAPSCGLEVATNDAIQIPRGTTAQRPTGENGMLRYNSDLGRVEAYANSSWVDVTGEVTKQTATTTSTTETAVATWAKADYVALEVTVTADDATDRTITKLLIAHDGTTAVATQYGEVNTDTALATYDVDISGTDVRLLATAASATSTSFTVKTVEFE